MHSQLILSTPSITIFTFFFIGLFLIPISYSQYDQNFTLCANLFDCGDLRNLSFPFWRDDRPQLCRQEGFGLTECHERQPVINISGHEFRVIRVNQLDFKMTIARADLWEKICPDQPPTYVNLADSPFLSYHETNKNLHFFYGCNYTTLMESKIPPTNRFGCARDSYSFYADDLVWGDYYRDFGESCDTGVEVQVHQSAFAELESGSLQLNDTLRQGFDVAYNFAEIFCPKCNSQIWNCSNLGSPQYSICSNPSPGMHVNLLTQYSQVRLNYIPHILSDSRFRVMEWAKITIGSSSPMLRGARPGATLVLSTVKRGWETGCINQKKIMKEEKISVN